MGRNKAKRIPRLKSLDELVEFFDKRDMGNYWDGLPKAKFEVKIKTRKHLVAIDEKIIPTINKIAKSKRVTSAKLINTWLREKIATSQTAPTFFIVSQRRDVGRGQLENLLWI